MVFPIIQVFISIPYTRHTSTTIYMTRAHDEQQISSGMMISIGILLAHVLGCEALRLLAPTRTNRRVHAVCMTEDAEVMQLVKMQCPVGLSAQAVSNAMLEAGALFVSVSDGAAGTNDEEPIFATYPMGSNTSHLESWSELMQAQSLWSNATLEVGFGPRSDVEGTLLSAAAISGMETLPRFSISMISSRDWVTEVQSNWPPIAMPGLTIKFPWHHQSDLEAAWVSTGADSASEIILELQPGMAFGTGEHATTQLCCAALRRLFATPAAQHVGGSVLDFGSGSGVLALAALEFGASSAVGIEIDPDALAVSLANAEINGLSTRFSAHLPQDEEARQYEVVVANILAGTIIELAELLESRVALGGTLLLSGIWGSEQVARVQAAFEDTCLGPFDVVFQDGWALLESSRSTAGTIE